MYNVRVEFKNRKNIYMNNGSSHKTFIFVVIAVIILIVAWFMMKAPAEVEENNMANNSEVKTIEKVEADPAGTIKSSGVSDSSLDQDASIIGAQLDLLNSETTDATAQ